MAKTAGHILKPNNVRLEGQVHLDLWSGQTPSTKQKSGDASIPQVRVIENHQEFAIVEVVCPCGRKMYLKCEYGDSQISI
jgi:hypothetical protein